MCASFCGTCGAWLAATAADRFASPGSYTPPHLAKSILTSRSALEGEPKQVTVLFCDLANSTPLAELLGPESMYGLLNGFFELALSCRSHVRPAFWPDGRAMSRRRA